MIKWIVGAIINAIFKGLFNKMNAKAVEKAKKERDVAQVAAVSAREVSDVEADITAKKIEAEKTFKEREIADDDPFSFKAFNAGDI